MTEINNPYICNNMAYIWSDEHRTKLMVDLSILWMLVQAGRSDLCHAYRGLTQESYEMIHVMSKRHQQTLKHDVAALVMALRQYLPGKYTPEILAFLHHRLTSSDLTDTAYAIQMDLSYRKLSLLGARVDRVIDSVFGVEAPCAGRTHGKIAQPMYLSHRGAHLRDNFRVAAGAIGPDAAASFSPKLSGPVGDGRGIVNLDECLRQACLRWHLSRPVATTSQIHPRASYAIRYGEIDRLNAFLRKLATDLRILAASGIEEWSEGFTEGQKGSSSMPHKRNPIRLERICGLTRVVQANCRVMTDIIETWLERDISNSSVERVCPLLIFGTTSYLLREMADILESGTWNFEQMTRNCPLVDTNQQISEAIVAGVDPEKAYRAIQDTPLAKMVDTVV